jgi:D-serine deaminase-like pyridoxal phosphate-dependent protein
VLVDAGALALSKDTGGGDTQHFGVVCDERGTPLDPPVVVERVCQEQGWLSSVDGFNNRTSEFPVGRKLCVLPNHSCMTTAAYNNYHVINEHGDVVDKWERCGGW